jgi:DNA-binding NarL/FixJ family response regulator
MDILIAEKRKDVRYGLATLLEEQYQINITGEAENFKELIQYLIEACPDVIFLSWELPDQKGDTLLKSIRLLCPDSLIIVMSNNMEAESYAFASGADNFISKADPPESLYEVMKHYLVEKEPGSEQYRVR